MLNIKRRQQKSHSQMTSEFIIINCIIKQGYPLSRVLDIEMESEEDEDTIIEKRRLLKKSIEQKYQYVSIVLSKSVCLSLSLSLCAYVC